jgi:hypothetical protein
MRSLGTNPNTNKEEQIHAPSDPLLSMLGVGQQIWESEPADQFVERLRSEEPVSPGPSRIQNQDLMDAAWQRIRQHQGELFHTTRGLPFTFEIEGNGIWFFRNRKRVNRKLTKSQVATAVSRCPLKSTTEIKDLMDFAYLYALLMDPRIRGQAW